jgi:hypothetical protein
LVLPELTHWPTPTAAPLLLLLSAQNIGCSHLESVVPGLISQHLQVVPLAKVRGAVAASRHRLTDGDLVTVDEVPTWRVAQAAAVAALHKYEAKDGLCCLLRCLCSLKLPGQLLHVTVVMQPTARSASLTDAVEQRAAAAAAAAAEHALTSRHRHCASPGIRPASEELRSGLRTLWRSVELFKHSAALPKPVDVWCVDPRVVEANIIIADVICQNHDEVGFLAGL